MTYPEVKQLVESFGLPYAYYEFPQDQHTVQAPPFVCFFFGSSDDFFADNSNFQPIRQLHIELYTDRKAFDLEAEFEERLRALELPYYKEPTYLKEERMHMTSYEMNVVITTDKKEDTPNA